MGPMACHCRKESVMSVRTQKLAWAAMGIFAIGAVSGWSAPNLLRTAAAAPAVAAISAAQAPASTSAVPALKAPIPLGTAPNYLAIVAQNQAAVVGISIVGSLKTAGGQSPFRGPSPFGRGGDDDDDPLFRFFRGIPQQPG